MEKAVKSTKEQEKIEELKVRRRKLPKFLLPAIGLILTLLLIWKGVQIYEYSQKPTEEKVKFPPEEAVAQVGKETLYGQDLNYKLKIYFPAVLSVAEDVSEEIKEKVLEQVIEDSMILQTGEEMKLVSLDPSVFNNSNKNYPERNKLINKARKELPSKVVDQINGESISIWFYNVEPPAMGVEEAKAITYMKMVKAYRDIKSGKISLKEAGDIIASDKELEEIDFAYKSNAHSTFTNVERDAPIFHDPELNKVLWTLKEGEISPILTGRDFMANNKAYDAYFVVLEVNRRNFAGFSSFEEWFQAEKDDYAIEILL